MPDSVLKNVKRGISRAFSIGSRLRDRYAHYFKHAQVDPRIMLFESYHGMTISDSPLHMLRALMDEGRAGEFTIYYATRKMEEHRVLVEKLGLPVRLVDIHSLEYPKVLATAKYIVNNSSLPAYFIKRDEQIHIETWHGTPLKTLGKRMRQGVESMYNGQHNFLHASYILFPNDFTRDVIMRDYNLNRLFTGKVAMMGYPRNDVLHDAQRAARIRERYGLGDRTVFAYMPTWRGTSVDDVHSAEYAAELGKILADLDESLTDDQVLYVSIHSLLQGKVSLREYKRVFPFPADVDGYDFLAAADVLITDYSSVFFDYSVTCKPIVLFLYDIDEYLADRGLYLDVETLPFCKVYSTEELATCLRDGAYREFDYSQSDYARDFLKYDAADNAHRALTLLFDDPDPSIELIDYAANKEREWNVVYGTQQRTTGDIDAISRTIDPERDIAWFNRASFTKGNSPYLYDNYCDSYDYVFSSNSYAETFPERIMKLAAPSVRGDLDARNRRRVFGDASIGSVRKNAFVAEPGYGVVGEAVPVAAVAESHPEGLYVAVSDDRFEVRTLLLVNQRQVVWSRALTQAEIDEGVIYEAFGDAVPLLDVAEDAPCRLQVGLGLLDKRTGDARYGVASLVGCASHDDDRLVEGCYPFKAGGAQTADAGAITLLPYLSGNFNALSILCACGMRDLEHVKRAQLVNLCAHGSRIDFTVRIRKGTFAPDELIMVYRSKVESVERRVPISLHVKGEWIHAAVRLEPGVLDLKPAIWDLYIGGHWGDVHRRIPIGCSNQFKWRLKVVNTQCNADGPFIAFPYTRGRARYLSLTYRERERFDTNWWRMKELTVFGSYFLLHRYWNNKRIWLVFEKQCALAQDNGFYFFKYCMDNLPAKERDHIYFVLKGDSPDRANIEPYKDHVLDFLSMKHMMYALASNVYVGSDAKTHLYGWRAKPNVISGRINKHKILFLQHGVTALKRDDDLFGKKGVTPMTYYLTTCDAEREVIVDNFGYARKDAPILGFARWDVLIDKSDGAAPMILLMPTWRPWLEHVDEEQFAQSDYCKAYSDLIADPGLLEFLKRNNATLKFFIHPKLSEMISAFASGNPRIVLVEQGSVPLNELIMECSALITDYSSVCWDVLYMDKPVVFYQFDQDVYNEVVGSYIDLNADLPGALCRTIPEALDALDACVERGFELSEAEREKADKWRAKHDGLNSARIYKFLADNGY